MRDEPQLTASETEQLNAGISEAIQALRDLGISWSTIVALVALLADKDIQTAVIKIIAVLRPQAE